MMLVEKRYMIRYELIRQKIWVARYRLGLIIFREAQLLCRYASHFDKVASGNIPILEGLGIVDAKFEFMWCQCGSASDIVVPLTRERKS